MRKVSWIAAAIILFISACTKIQSTNIGSGLIPPIDGVTTLDTTFDILTDNFRDFLSDSLKVYYNDDHVIGVIKDDPIFGKTTASAFFELKPTFYKYGFAATEVKADSAVLILSYKGAYGNTTIPQQWEVRELAETMRHDTTYPATTTFATGAVLNNTSKNQDISSFDDSVHVAFEDAQNQIRIKLDASFARRMIEQYDSLPGNAYASDSLFRANFKGFAVVPAPGTAGNALVRINLLDTNTKLALYYNYHPTDSAVDVRKNTVSYFRFSNGSGSSVVSASANYIKRDYSGSEVASVLGGSSTNDDHVYIATAPGTFATLTIPGLGDMPNAIIHRAELSMVQDRDANQLDTSLTPPNVLLLSYYDSLNRIKRNIPNDFVVSAGVTNISTFGGNPINKDVPGLGVVKSYVFDLTRYVQGIVTRKDKSQVLRLSAPVNDTIRYSDPYPATTASGTFYFTPASANNPAQGRVRLFGGNPALPNRMRLRIIYSRI